MECPAMRKLKHGSVHPKGSRGERKAPCRRRSGDSPCSNKSQEAEVCTAKGWRGRAQSPLLAPAGAKSLRFGKEPLCNVQKVGRAAWGRVCGRAKLLAGTLRCLRLCWRFPWNWSPAKQLGRCPKPHKGRCPLTLQGEIFPLTPFARLSWSLFLASSACCSALFPLPS